MKQKDFKFPSPLGIALSLTALVFVLSLVIKIYEGNSFANSLSSLVIAWYEGLWDNSSGGLYFAFQMMFILVLGHVLALTEPFRRAISFISNYCSDSAQAAVLISVTAILLGYLNWALALVLSALMVKNILIKFHLEGKKLNIGLLGAAAYSCMLVWHGGLSGSSPTKAGEVNAIRDMMINAGYSVNPEFPQVITTSETLFSTLNIAVFWGLLISLPASLYIAAKRTRSKIVSIPISKTMLDDAIKFQWNWSAFTGIMILVVGVFIAIQNASKPSGFLNINFINFILLGSAILLHNDFDRFIGAVQAAIQDASGILIQFPIYFGIIGLMKAGGLTFILSNVMAGIATPESFPLLAWISAGIVNFFIPSGGGQFYIQGPILIQSAVELGVSIPKTIMALSYGDQWTNMLQPFWAIPLIGITKIKLSELAPYCILLYAVSGIIFGTALYFF
jgi:short-chain fatty acids transporter